MAIELVLRNWCDVCQAAGTQTPADTYTVSVASETVGVPVPFDVELCHEHAEPLGAAIGALAPLGRSPGKTARPGPVGASKGRPRADQTPGRVTCPECGASYSTLAIIRSHLRHAHDKSLADVGLAPANVTCPECGAAFQSRTGLSSHVRAAHGTGAKRTA